MYNNSNAHTQNPPPEVLVLLSGGIDSTTCLHFFLDLGRPTCGLFIDYQQASVKHEYYSSDAIANYYGIHLFKTKWNGVNTKKDGVIPSRNAFLLTAALMEAPYSVNTIALGIHDGTSYNDCSMEFVEAMQEVFNIYKEKNVSISTPFIQWSKQDINDYAISNNVPTHLTYSCELGYDMPCGKCLSCLDREALKVVTGNNI